MYNYRYVCVYVSYIRIILLYFGWRDFFVLFYWLWFVFSIYVYLLCFKKFKFSHLFVIDLLQMSRDILSSRVSTLHLHRVVFRWFWKHFLTSQVHKVYEAVKTRRKWRWKRRRRRRNKRGVAGGNRTQIRLRSSKCRINKHVAIQRVVRYSCCLSWHLTHSGASLRAPWWSSSRVHSNQVSMLRSTVSVGRSVKWNEINFDILSSFFVFTNPNPNKIPAIILNPSLQKNTFQTHLSQQKKKKTKITAFSGNVPKTESKASYSS